MSPEIPFGRQHFGHVPKCLESAEHTSGIRGYRKKRKEEENAPQWSMPTLRAQLGRRECKRLTGLLFGESIGSTCIGSFGSLVRSAKKK